VNLLSLARRWPAQQGGATAPEHLTTSVLKKRWIYKSFSLPKTESTLRILKINSACSRSNFKNSNRKLPNKRRSKPFYLSCSVFSSDLPCLNLYRASFNFLFWIRFGFVCVVVWRPDPLLRGSTDMCTYLKLCVGLLLISFVDRLVGTVWLNCGCGIMDLWKETKFVVLLWWF